MNTFTYTICSIMFLMLYSCKSSEELKQQAIDKYDKDIYGVEVSLGTPIFENSPKRAFNGDGTSIYVFDLPPEIRARFTTPDTELLSKFPKRPDYRNDWSVMTWREASFDQNLIQYLDFALYGANKYSDEIQQALSRKGTYYAFFHYDHGDRPGDIDLFVVDLVGGRIYSINVNT